MNPKFSIIVPVYNVVTELRRAVTSVMQQTFPDWELVLVDDGSTDGSEALCDSFGAQDPRIKVVHKSNGGVVSARLAGFQESTGDWIVFLDGDDEIVPEALSKIHNAIQRQRCEIVQYEYMMVKNGLEVEPECSNKVMVRSVGQIIDCVKHTPLDILGMCIWNKCYSRSIAEQAFADVGDVRISHSEDGLFAFAALLHAHHVYFSHDVLYRYVLRTSSAVHRVNVSIVSDRIQFMDRMRQLAERSGRMSKEQIARMLDFHAYQGCCYIFLMLKRNKASWGSIKKVLAELRESEFFRQPNREVRSVKRRLMYFLIRHPYLYAMAARCGLVH